MPISFTKNPNSQQNGANARYMRAFKYLSLFDKNETTARPRERTSRGKKVIALPV